MPFKTTVMGYLTIYLLQFDTGIYLIQFKQGLVNIHQ